MGRTHLLHLQCLHALHRGLKLLSPGSDQMEAPYDQVDRLFAQIANALGHLHDARMSAPGDHH